MHPTNCEIIFFGLIFTAYLLPTTNTIIAKTLAQRNILKYFNEISLVNIFKSYSPIDQRITRCITKTTCIPSYNWT